MRDSQAWGVCTEAMEEKEDLAMCQGKLTSEEQAVATEGERGRGS